MATDYTEQLFDSIKGIVTHELQEVSFDTTKICTIVDDKDAANGKYIVSDGNIKFEAYSEYTKYHNDDLVRITVLNGDWGERKYIDGRHVQDNSVTPITYVSPTESMLEMTDNLVSTSKQKTWGIIANGSQLEKCIWSIDLSESDYIDVQQNSVYDTLFLGAEFKTNFSDYNICKGKYGLRLDLEVAATQDYSSKIIRQAHLDISDMLGDPYNFMLFSKQGKRFDIEYSGVIKRMALYLYQSNDFQYIDNNNIKQLEPFIFDNIVIRNVKISLGTDLQKMPDNIVKIYSEDSKTFDQSNNAASNEKQLSLLWYNKDENNKYIGFSDGKADLGYDEKKYLELVKHINELKMQQGKNYPEDEFGLTYAADISQMKIESQIFFNLINKDLFTFLTNYNQAFADIPELQEQFDLILNQTKKEEITALEQKLIDFYDIVEKSLQYGGIHYKHQYGETQEEKEAALPEEKPSLTNITDPIQISTLIQNYLNLCLAQEKKITEKVSSDFPGYLGLCDNKRILMKRILDPINQHKEIFDSLTTNKLNNLSTIFLNDDYKYASPYVSQDLTPHHNKYCVYWYYKTPKTQHENDEFMGNGWVLIEAEKINIGLPSDPKDYVTKDRELYYPIKSSNKADSIKTIQIDGKLTDIEYAAIVFYNHEMYKSESIAFENVDKKSMLDEASVDANGALFIEHSTNSKDSYQSYGINNYLLNMRDSCIPRRLHVRFQGVEQRDEALVNTHIYWYVPSNSTMLVTEYEKDLQGFTKSDSGPEARVGYTCFYKTISEKKESEQYIDTYFTYRIDSYYSPTRKNNTIYCMVLTDNNQKFETSITMNFSSFGTSGTDYTLVLKTPPAQTGVGPNTPLKLTVQLYNYKNELQPLNNFNAVWLNKNMSGYTLALDKENNTIIVKKNSKSNTKNGIIKVCSVADFNNKQINLEAYYPIPYANFDTNAYIEGPTTIVYDTQGKNPTYFKRPYTLYDSNHQKRKDNIKWIMSYYDDKGTKCEYSTLPLFDQSYYPKLNKDNELVPSNMYIEPEPNATVYYPVVEAYDTANNLLWAQPLLIIQNRYPSAMLNSWDGKLTINENNGTILSTMVGAGTKNTKNQFNGVLMGNIGASADMQALGDKTGIGLYGFHEGSQSFCFNIDGTAFLGKSGKGRINFDGNKGTIESATYDQMRRKKSEQPAGMCIDLDDGFIDMRGANNQTQTSDGTHSVVHLSVIAPYFYIDSANGNRLINISGADPYNEQNYNQGYYLRSDNYKHVDFITTDNIQYPKDGGEKGSGMLLDLSNGKIDAFNLKMTSSHVMIDSTEKSSVYLVIKGEKGKNLLYCGNDAYYLQTNNYSDTEGLKINLVQGTIDAHDFTLNATTGNGHIKLNSNPKTSEHFLDIGNSETYLKISQQGNVDLKAKKFNLNTTTIYFSDIAQSYSITNYGDKSVQLKIGSNFGVTSDGNVYASSAYLSGANVSGTITTNNLTATGGSIGGWKISGGNLTCGDVTLSGTNGSISGSAISGGSITGSTISGGSINIGDGSTKPFSVNKQGVLNAIGATLKDLTISTSLTVTDTAQVKISGRMGINTEVPAAGTDLEIKGNAKFNGNLIMGNTSASRIYGGGISNDLCIYFDANQIYVAGPTLQLRSHKILIGYKGDENNIHLYGNLYAGPNDTIAKDCVVKFNAGLFGKDVELTFSRGILIGVSGDSQGTIDGSSSSGDGSYITKNDLKQWNVTRTFKISASGSKKVRMADWNEHYTGGSLPSTVYIFHRTSGHGPEYIVSSSNSNIYGYSYIGRSGTGSIKLSGGSGPYYGAYTGTTTFSITKETDVSLSLTDDPETLKKPIEISI